jgi:hypothetical protein
MNAKATKSKGQRFQAEPPSGESKRRAQEVALERFKRRLAQKAAYQAEDARLVPWLRHAANEAAALAWTTPFPMLFLPQLLEEKAEAVRRYVRRQDALRPRSDQQIELAE